MRRVLLLVAALAALGFSAEANAAVIRGVVIAKDAKRKAVVTAAPKGAVRTIRLGAKFRRARLGQRIVTRASRLPDGTFLGRGFRAKNRVRHTRFGATVIRREATGRLIFSAGRSVFVLRLRSAASSSLFNDDEDDLEAGDQVSCDADVGSGGLTADPEDVDEVGHTNRLELEGIYLETSENRIELAVAHRGRVFVNVPEGMELACVRARRRDRARRADRTRRLVHAHSRRERGRVRRR